MLVSCPRNTRYFAGGQLAVFQGGPSRTGGEAPISESYGSSEPGARRAEKQPTGPGPEGCDENGPAAAGSVTYRFRYAPSYRQSLLLCRCLRQTRVSKVRQGLDVADAAAWGEVNG